MLGDGPDVARRGLDAVQVPGRLRRGEHATPPWALTPSMRRVRAAPSSPRSASIMPTSGSSIPWHRRAAPSRFAWVHAEPPEAREVERLQVQVPGGGGRSVGRRRTALHAHRRPRHHLGVLEQDPREGDDAGLGDGALVRRDVAVARAEHEV